MKIKRAALEFILEAGKNSYPKEFAGLLRGKEDTITEILILPGTKQWFDSASINRNMLPLDPSVVGSIHSHPSMSNRPSRTDLMFFSKFGNVHGIICQPYDFESLRFYDQSGREIEVIPEY
jgi:proteasome lid subunit RPN8/RPN11